MDKKQENQGPIINSGQEDQKPLDYSHIEQLRKEAGVTPEYLQSIREEYKKALAEKLRTKL